MSATSCGEQGAVAQEQAAEVVQKEGEGSESFKEGKEGCNCCGAKEAGVWVPRRFTVSPLFWGGEDVKKHPLK